jgi:hypothetical protein
MKKTDWFSSYVPPVHEGLYEMRNESTGLIFMAFFERGVWFLGESSRILVHVWPWRGLKEPA